MTGNIHSSLQDLRLLCAEKMQTSMKLIGSFGGTYTILEGSPERWTYLGPSLLSFIERLSSFRELIMCLLVSIHAVLSLLLILFQFSLWLRDILDDLCHHKLRDIGDFEWQRAIRPYLKEVDLNSTDTLTYQGDDPSSKEEEIRPENTVVLQCLDNQIEYGFEYLGCASIPVFTSRANNYIIAFTQVRRHNYYNVHWTMERLSSLESTRESWGECHFKMPQPTSTHSISVIFPFVHCLLSKVLLYMFTCSPILVILQAL